MRSKIYVRNQNKILRGRMDFTTVLGSGVVAGLVAGLVTLRTTERKIAIENITQQRQLWRDKIRKKAIEAIEAYKQNEEARLYELYVEFQLILNPEDNDDKSILDTLWKMKNGSKESDPSIELSEKLSLLLKHDWERAKREAKPMWFHWRQPERTSYINFMNKQKCELTNKVRS
jgi:hypothetical protein